MKKLLAITLLTASLGSLNAGALNWSNMGEKIKEGVDSFKQGIERETKKIAAQIKANKQEIAQTRRKLTKAANRELAKKSLLKKTVQRLESQGKVLKGKYDGLINKLKGKKIKKVKAKK